MGILYHHDVAGIVLTVIFFICPLIAAIWVWLFFAPGKRYPTPLLVGAFSWIAMGLAIWVASSVGYDYFRLCGAMAGLIASMLVIATLFIFSVGRDL
ncbi:MAG: hypothetical protein ACYDCX_11880 [Acidithiobacillus sp.]